MADCPTCKQQGLRHTLLEDGLPALGCGNCEGTLLSLVAYRRWKETALKEPREFSSQPEIVAVDSKRAVTCPKCRGVMIKYRISSDVDNRLDYCGHCEEIWLDKGEWDLVEAVARSGRLFKILTRPWQRRILDEQTAEMELMRLQEKLGDDYERFREIKDWLDAHPARDEIIAQFHRRNC
jgi:Zn-finger nucleic acid-binding protein